MAGTQTSAEKSTSTEELATRMVERALAATGLLDHMHLAYIHVMSACDALYALFAVQA